MEVIETRKQGARLRLPDTDPARAAEVLKGMVRDGVPVIEFHREERNLEDAFIDIPNNIAICILLPSGILLPNNKVVGPFYSFFQF